MNEWAFFRIFRQINRRADTEEQGYHNRTNGKKQGAHNRPDDATARVRIAAVIVDRVLAIFLDEFAILGQVDK